ncbi:MAG: HNH endonuclease [Clostridia bacterium]|nr:HNH endonuclease [Clostridia bacterium]
MNSNTDQFPLTAYSWQILTPNIFLKTLDRSAFYHHGTGIPKEIRIFWGANLLTPGKSKDTFLNYKGKNYDCSLVMSQDHRTRLFWKADFSDLLKQALPEWYLYFAEGDRPEESFFPRMRLERVKLGPEIYKVDFILPEQIKADILSEEEEEYNTQTEGEIQYYSGTRYERDPENRKKAIEYHGTVCVICGFDFEHHYGERGRGFIEIHHIAPLSGSGIHEVNPKTDLIPVCSNCHKMIHRKKDNILSIEIMKKIYRD